MKRIYHNTGLSLWWYLFRQTWDSTSGAYSLKIRGSTYLHLHRTRAAPPVEAIYTSGGHSLHTSSSTSGGYSLQTSSSTNGGHSLHTSSSTSGGYSLQTSSSTSGGYSLQTSSSTSGGYSLHTSTSTSGHMQKCTYNKAITCIWTRGNDRTC